MELQEFKKILIESINGILKKYDAVEKGVLAIIDEYRNKIEELKSQEKAIQSRKDKQDVRDNELDKREEDLADTAETLQKLESTLDKLKQDLQNKQSLNEINRINLEKRETTLARDEELVKTKLNGLMIRESEIIIREKKAREQESLIKLMKEKTNEN